MVQAAGTRDHILESAAAVVLREGANNLTLERVAREAGISKGGLLYHFSAKERLIQALMERMIGHFAEDLASHELREVKDEPGRRTRAFVRTTLEGVWDRKTGLKPHGVNMLAALLAAVATDPALLAPLKDSYACWQAALDNDRITPARAAVIRLAADGLWFAEVLGLVNFDSTRRREIIEEMLSLTASAKKPRAPRLRLKRATA